MLEPMEENPLGLPLGQDNLPHQLRLTRPEGLDAARRTNLLQIDNHGVALLYKVVRNIEQGQA